MNDLKKKKLKLNQFESCLSMYKVILLFSQN